jgi:DNA-binding LacI/PurR family transcriptional regulator
MKNDLTYRKQGLFAAFIPETLAGENAWRAIAEQTQGTGKVFTAMLPAVLAQIRKAGYTVRIGASKSKKETEREIAAILAELEGGDA